VNLVAQCTSWTCLFGCLFRITTSMWLLVFPADTYKSRKEKQLDDDTIVLHLGGVHGEEKQRIWEDMGYWEPDFVAPKLPGKKRANRRAAAARPEIITLWSTGIAEGEISAVWSSQLPLPAVVVVSAAAGSLLTWRRRQARRRLQAGQVLVRKDSPK